MAGGRQTADARQRSRRLWRTAARRFRRLAAGHENLCLRQLGRRGRGARGRVARAAANPAAQRVRGSWRRPGRRANSPKPCRRAAVRAAEGASFWPASRPTRARRSSHARRNRRGDRRAASRWPRYRLAQRCARARPGPTHRWSLPRAVRSIFDRAIAALKPAVVTDGRPSSSFAAARSSFTITACTTAASPRSTRGAIPRSATRSSRRAQRFARPSVSGRKSCRARNRGLAICGMGMRDVAFDQGFRSVARPSRRAAVAAPAASARRQIERPTRLSGA